MQSPSISNNWVGRSQRILFLPIIVLILASMACSLFQGKTDEHQPAQPASLMLIGKWEEDLTRQIIEYTESEFILYDFPAPDNELHVKYTLLNDHTIQLDLENSAPFEFSVDENTLTKINQDGTVSTYSRIKSP